jgi:hypothetical protein
MTRLFLAGAISLAMLSGAGGAPAEPAPMAQVPSPKAADPVTRDLAHRYLATIHFRETMSRMIDQIFPTMLSGMMANAQSLTAEQKAALVSSGREMMADFAPRFEDKAAEVIAGNYTAEELTALVNFYESPIGRQITDKSLNLQQVTAQSVQSLAPQMMQDMFRRLCDKIACPASLKAQFPNQS